jgi:hypothetical protein
VFLKISDEAGYINHCSTWFHGEQITETASHSFIESV